MASTENSNERGSDTLMIRCPVCFADAGETLGVTGPMSQPGYASAEGRAAESTQERELAATVVMRCDDCGTVYLSPPPAHKPGQGNAGHLTAYDQAIGQVKRDFPAGSRVLCAEVGDDSFPARVQDSDRFDLVMLPLSLETAPDPGAFLTRAAKFLDHGGCIDLIVGNTESACFAVFGGRHWFGYRFPAARQFFGLEGIQALAIRHGLRVESSRTLSAPNAWLISARNWLRDWGAKGFLTRVVTGRWLIPWLLASLIEGIAGLRGRAAVRVVRLNRG